MFEPHDPALLDHINEHGYATVNALTPDEAAARAADFWEWLEGLGTGIDRTDPTTWGPTQWPHNSHGVIQTYGVGQAAFMWKIRGRVRRAFQTIWGTDELIVSFDGAGCHPKPAPARWWPHRDQSPLNQNPMCVQGAVNLLPTDGGTVVFPGSHRIDFATRYGATTKDNWYRIPDGDPDITADNAVVVSGPPGTLVLWDSRTIHMNKPPTTGQRMVAYVCMVPRQWASASIITKRNKYYLDHRTTSHWPHNVKVNSESIFRAPEGAPDPKVIRSQIVGPPYGHNDPVVRRLVGV